MKNKKTITIVGGGITGLTTAYYLQKKVKEEGLPYHVSLIEEKPSLGGKIQTIKKNGYMIERGPDSFLARKYSAIRLAKNLGIEKELIRNSTGQAYILVGDTLHKMPKGSYMGIPTDLDEFFQTNLLSVEGKKRVLEDLSLPKSNIREDQSLGHFFRYRFGNELVENIIEPLLSGIYSGDMDKMSLFATFPDFYRVEQQYGSLIKGFQQMNEKPKVQTGKQKGQFLTFKDGLSTLVEHLEENIKDEVTLVHDKVLKVEKQLDGYKLELQKSGFLQSDVVIMTTPHQLLPKLFPNVSIFKTLLKVPANSVANVALAFDESDVKQNLNGTGFVVSRNSNFRITACTWTYRKWKTTTPEGKILLRAYVGKPDDQEVVQLTDDELVDIVLKDLSKTMDMTAAPEFSIVTRWNNAMPQYTLGHKDRVEAIYQELQKELPGIFVAGSSFGGVGIPDCIDQGEKAVEKTIAFLKENEAIVKFH